MKHSIIISIYLIVYSVCYAQEQENIIAALEQHAEYTAENGGAEKDDESFMIQMENLKKHPINLNRADADDLKQLVDLSALQIDDFLKYRHIFGDLLDVYELQAVPTWNIDLIKKILPYVEITQSTALVDNIKDRWNNGSHSILLRTSRVLEKSAGYDKQPDSTGNHFLGSATRLTFRYNYNYRNLLQWGLSGDKDAGEQFFKGKQRLGFDFYSFHLFLSKLGLIKALAIGDFTINMGQGLIQWQSLAFSKSPEITSIKRQAAVLHPYTATGESDYHRGAGITLQKSRWEGTLFFSRLKLTGNLVKDSIGEEGHISSINSSGYHRTRNELEDRNNLQQLTAGACLKFTANNWNIALNAIRYKFSSALKKDDKPYNRFAASGKDFRNESIDYSYTYKNVHLFGELAMDKNNHPAFVNGLLAAVSPAVDLSFVYRTIDKSYQSFNSDAFTENSDPNNETGLFAGISIRPSEYIRLNAYTDSYHFPWLKYRVDAPSAGREYYIQLICNPNKQVELYTHFRSELRQQNLPDAGPVTAAAGNVTKQNLRVHTDVSINRSVSIRSRAEMVFYNKKQSNEEEGFLMFTDLLYKSPARRWSGNSRIEYFETNGYNSRLYAFENDVQYNFSIPAVFDKGYRFYVNLNYDLSKFTKRFISKTVTAECWMKFAQTIYDKKERMGTGLDEIDGNKKSELKFQVMIYL